MNGLSGRVEVDRLKLGVATIARVLGTKAGAGLPDDAVFSSFAIDSRRVEPGCLFFALRGPNHDGHSFIGAAIEAGAKGVVVSDPASASHEGVARFLVPDTTRALQDLAASVRPALSLVVGITGSAGKTTAKEMTAAALERRRPTGKTIGNLNNLFGLPLALLNLTAGARAAVLEMGMSYPGEIARLVEIANPDIGVILNVREVHLENFESIEAIARAKGELFRGMRKEATAVWNAADPRVRLLASGFSGPKVSYAVGAPADLVAREIEDDIVSGARFRLIERGREIEVRLAVFGRHNVENALAALAVARAAGDDVELAANAVSRVPATKMRGQTLRLGQGLLLVDDTYNSNPSAMASVLASLATTAWTGRKVLVAGDMLELGSRSAEFHRQVGEQAARAGVGLLVAVGPLAAETAGGATRLGLARVALFRDSEEAAQAADTLLAPGDMVVVKGSRGIAMERFVAAAKSVFGEGGS